MEGTQQSPLTIKQRPRITHRKVSSVSSALSASSYPQIPSRRSSLHIHTDDSSSSELATSTRTPSLTDSLYNIEVAKIRPTQGRRIQGPRAPRRGFDHSCDPFVDQTPRRYADTHGKTTRRETQLAPQLLVRWSSGSYALVEPCVSSDSSSSSSSGFGRMGQLTGTMSQQNDSRVNSVRSVSTISDSDLICPLELPVAFAKIRSYAGKPCLGTDYSMSLWTSVNVTADVDPFTVPDNSRLGPLDMIVLFDNPHQPSVGGLSPMMLASSILTSNLIPNRDRLAVACVDGSMRNGFDLLLPLGFHPFDRIRAAFDAFYLRQIKRNQRPRVNTDLSHTLRQICQLFRMYPRAAYGHLVLVSGNYPSPDPLLISGIDRAIGVHTLSPHSRFPLDTQDHPLGWHIPYDEHAENLQSEDSHLMRKVSQFVRQVRTGITAGFLSNLDLYMVLGRGCILLSETPIDHCRLERLRPGEKWITKVKVGVPDFYHEVKWQLTAHPIIQDLIHQLDEVIAMYSSQSLAQYILSSGLKYEHSLLSEPHEVCLESHCTIARDPNLTFRPPLNDANLELLSYEDAGSISASFGSASEVS
ncbi:unnamed protein product [Penicillium olsonii]|nr:unnamed protein product [Penicillium olsonii]CAG7922562.1 unnamed protein product [Penicillium olsonii]